MRLHRRVRLHAHHLEALGQIVRGIVALAHSEIGDQAARRRYGHGFAHARIE